VSRVRLNRPAAFAGFLGGDLVCPAVWAGPVHEGHALRVAEVSPSLCEGVCDGGAVVPVTASGDEDAHSYPFSLAMWCSVPVSYSRLRDGSHGSGVAQSP